MSRTKIVTLTTFLRTCEKITRCRVAAGFLAWSRREGGGNTRSGVADALHRPAACLRQAVSLRTAVPCEQRRPIQKRHATLWARARQAVWPRCPLGYSLVRGCTRVRLAIRPFLLSRGASNFVTGSQTGTASFMNLVRICKAWSPCAAKSLPRQSVRSR
jgi:hypothetical protein